MEQLTFREELSRGTMVFDGGMGTYFSASEKLPGQGCEMANIEKPLLISAIHREYLEAGARAIKTNTFSSNRVAIPAETMWCSGRFGRDFDWTDGRSLWRTCFCGYRSGDRSG